MRILGLIPARGGSKGVPGKNIRDLHGKPLLWYTAQTALNCRSLHRVILSTENEEIAEIGKDCGVEVPFMRPAALARDDTPTLPVIKHALTELCRRGDSYDAVCLLQPTSPLRRREDVEACILLMNTTNADTVISVLRVPDEYNPKWVYWRGPDGQLSISTGDDEPIRRRQELPPAYHRDGSVYLTRSSGILDDNSIYGRRILGYEIPPEFSSNIDSEDDWRSVEHRLTTHATDEAI